MKTQKLTPMSKMRLKKDDLVRVITGTHKGKTGKILQVHPQAMAVTIEGIDVIKRHIKPNQLNPQGGTKEIHRPLDVSKVALVNPSDNAKTTRIGYLIKKDGTKVRTARQAANKEIK